MLFTTKYFVHSSGAQATLTTLFARNEEHARDLIDLRGMGEVLQVIRNTRPVLCSEHLREGKFGQAMHSMCWMAMIACKAGIVTGNDLFSDVGVAHQLSHFTDYADQHGSAAATAGYQFKGLLHDVVAFEKKVPGMWPAEECDFAGGVYPHWHEESEESKRLAREAEAKRILVEQRFTDFGKSFLGLKTKYQGTGKAAQGAVRGLLAYQKASYTAIEKRILYQLAYVHQGTKLWDNKATSIIYDEATLIIRDYKSPVRIVGMTMENGLKARAKLRNTTSVKNPLDEGVITGTLKATLTEYGRKTLDRLTVENDRYAGMIPRETARHQMFA